jgi:ABC-type transport system involved in cytochrome bd biosynthesis fused ATPase/permease subunit
MDLKTIAVALAVIAGMLAFNHWVENPWVEALATEKAEHACTIRTAEAAETARQAAQAQATATAEVALEQYRKSVAAKDALQEQAQSQLEEDIVGYEEKLEAAGRSCKLDRSDFEWLRN